MVTISINLSNNCNMSCKYCFRKDEYENYSNLTFEEMKSFIIDVSNEFPNKRYFEIDLTGAGEPLLRSNEVIELIIFTESISTLERTFKVTFCTNGTLLSRQLINFFKEHDIYFGISIDGDRKVHEKLRGKNSINSYKLIKKNIRKINSKYIGASLTITNKNLNILKSFQSICNKFDSVSMKPVRSDSNDLKISQKSIKQLLKYYDQFFENILNQIKIGNSWVLLSIIRGEDIFGKFIRRIFLNQSVIARCNGGISKFFLDVDRNIYVCGAANISSTYKIGSLNKGLDFDRIHSSLNNQTNRIFCSKCWAKYICGGICMLIKDKYVLNDIVDNDTLCILNKHLINLSISLRLILEERYPSVFKNFVKVCLDNYYR
ncbi:radical SAM protein [Mycoplasmatota bacterium]|nr:radical SAM protein [Mycoplasmatota bacterium]